MNHVLIKVLNEEQVAHFNLFPSELAETVRQQSGVDAYRVSLTQGHWDHSNWGSPVLASAPGAELHAVLDGSSPVAWSRLTNALSGLLCSSLSFLRAEENVVRPQLQEFYAESGRKPPLQRAQEREEWIGVLPREHVCTENLTPFFKLLPCKNEAGLAALLHPESVFDVAYHAMHTYVSVRCANESAGYQNLQNSATSGGCSQHRLRVEQSVTVVTEAGAYGGQAPSGTLGAVLKHPGATKAIEQCAVAESSIVYRMYAQDGGRISRHGVITNNTDVVFDVQDDPDVRRVLQLPLTAIITSNADSTVSNGGHADVSMVPLHVQRHALVQGRDQGQIRTRLWNTGSEALVVHTLQILPWFLRVFTHTLDVYDTVSVSLRTQPAMQPLGSTCRQRLNSTHGILQPQRLSHATLMESAYSPARDREDAGAWELVFCIPPHTAIVFEFAYAAGFLRLPEYPPDPHRGFAVPALVLTARNLDTTAIGATRGQNRSIEQVPMLSLRSTHLSILMPTPDFSMPFNVIALTSTALALAMGTFIQYSTRLLVEE